MKRNIIRIDEDKCNGCGLCARACHEGAIDMVEGKAHLLREDYCDGLGDCLPACPVNAISFETREAPAYDHQAVLTAKAAKQEQSPCGCPGSRSKELRFHSDMKPLERGIEVPSQLAQWPVQLKLVPIQAPYFHGAELLVAADCTAFAYGDFHRRFIQGRVALIGCPKLDQQEYAEKLAQILQANQIRGVTVIRMEVPCCGGLVQAVKRAVQASGKKVPCRAVILSTDGKIVEDRGRL